MSRAKTLFLDIENAPLVAYSWGPSWKTNLIEVVRHNFLLCFAYRWGEDGPTEVVAQPDFKAYRKDRTNDEGVAKAAHKLLSDADIVVAHNLVKFDAPMLNASFLRHGLGRPKPYATVDTLRVAQRQFRLPSNRLNDLGGMLNLGHKLPHTGFQLWSDCMAGVPEAWDLMKAYNIQDIDLLVDVFKTFKYQGWITDHPNVSVIENHDGCPTCGADEKHLKRRGIRGTDVNRYVQLRCNICGSYSRSRFVEERAPLTRRRAV